MLPIRLPPLDHLTNEELQALQAKLLAAAREARRKANSAIMKTESLKETWNRMLSLKKKSPPEEREGVLSSFERELLKQPECFIAHAFANSLVMVEAACRKETFSRSNGKKRATEPPPPEEVIEFSSILGEFIPD